jgi:hypothetical protein
MLSSDQMQIQESEEFSEKDLQLNYPFPQITLDNQMTDYFTLYLMWLSTDNKKQDFLIPCW